VFPVVACRFPAFPFGFLLLFLVSLGSKLSEASIVSTTTDPNAAMPTPALMTAKPWICTSPVSSDTTKTSSIDQRPMISMM
jgi:hypothetical protein